MKKGSFLFGLFGTGIALVTVIFLSYPFMEALLFAACTNTTNMSLCKPAIGDSGWGTNANDNSDKIDTHDHSSGKGVQIPAGGIVNSAITTSKIANNSVDGTKIALGSDAQGDIAYFNGTDWARLAAGTSGNFLKTQGASANPIWDAATTITTVRKTADETVNNSVTLQNDDALLLALAANETWYFIAVLSQIGNNTADFKFAFTVPTGATLNWGCVGKINTAGTAGPCDSITTSGTADDNDGATDARRVTLRGVVVNGGTAGNLQLQWAQSTATVVDTKVLTNSYLEAHK